MLHAMMLPSGNDAAVALAQHFGRVLQEQTVASEPTARDPTGWSAESCYLRFVKEMNSFCAARGWRSCSFGNQHGELLI